MISLRLLISNSYDPWFNLTVENFIFHRMSKCQHILFLWRNNNSVIIGRAQNPWKECNTRRMHRDNIKLARRSTGGGAVFHDLGNTCFTFMSSKPEYDKNSSTNIILDALLQLGIKATISGRNDLIIKTINGERKISGSAYLESPHHGLHHGTLLLNTDLDKLQYYLNPDIKKLEIKGITSVRSRVANINELYPKINHEQLCQTLQKTFIRHYQNYTVKPEFISQQTFSQSLEFTHQLEKQSHWEWNFGTAPEFSHQLETRFIWGNITLHFNIKHGVISNNRIFTDSLDPEPIEALETCLSGISYDAQAIKNCCQQWMKMWPQHKYLIEVSDWIVTNVY